MKQKPITIAIDASKVNVRSKTGTEKYAYEMVRRILDTLDSEYRVILYTQDSLPQEILSAHPGIRERIISWKGAGWTLIGLSLALFKDKPDVFYTPASILPLWHPRNSYPVIHGLEYEAFPQAYSFFRFWHLALFTLFSAQWAKKTIVPSHSTRSDLISEYNISEKTIEVVHSGIDLTQISSQEVSKYIQCIAQSPYLFWIGRKEVRKNVTMVIDIFDSLKEEYHDLTLILAGKEGFGYDDIKDRREKSLYCDDIIEVGFIQDTERDYLYQHAQAFLFPSWYEGFGYPVLEAFRAGVPVLVSDSSSLPEIAGNAAQVLPIGEEKAIGVWHDAVKSLLDIPAERSRWIVLGKERVADFTLQEAVDKTLSVILAKVSR